MVTEGRTYLEVERDKELKLASTSAGEAQELLKKSGPNKYITVGFHRASIAHDFFCQHFKIRERIPLVDQSEVNQLGVGGISRADYQVGLKNRYYTENEKLNFRKMA